MNCKDIEAARKLIAQFEDRADGRHNSTRLAGRDTALRDQLVESARPPVHNGPAVQESRGLMTGVFEWRPLTGGIRDAIRSAGVAQIRYRDHPEPIGPLEHIWNVQESRWRPVRFSAKECEIGDLCHLEYPGRMNNYYGCPRIMIPKRPEGAMRFFRETEVPPMDELSVCHLEFEPIYIFKCHQRFTYWRRVA